MSAEKAVVAGSDTPPGSPRIGCKRLAISKSVGGITIAYHKPEKAKWNDSVHKKQLEEFDSRTKENTMRNSKAARVDTQQKTPPYNCKAASVDTLQKTPLYIAPTAASDFSDDEDYEQDFKRPPSSDSEAGGEMFNKQVRAQHRRCSQLMRFIQKAQEEGVVRMEKPNPVAYLGCEKIVVVDVPKFNAGVEELASWPLWQCDISCEDKPKEPKHKAWNAYVTMRDMKYKPRMRMHSAADPEKKDLFRFAEWIYKPNDHSVKTGNALERHDARVM